MRSLPWLLVSVIFVLVWCNTATAQPDVVREILREKIRWTPEQLRKALHDTANGGHALSKIGAGAGERESVVSGGPDVESEVHAAINPTDSNNIIVSPISQGGAGLLCPVYYTRNFGATWDKSDFENTPPGEDPLTVGGGDPILGFDGNGTAYMVWISIYVEGFGFDTLHYGLFWAYSNDGGSTWKRSDSDAVVLSVLVNGSGNDDTIYDKEWIAADRSGGQFHNTMYLAFLEASQSGQHTNIVVRKKIPGSQQFTHTSVPVAGANFTTLQFTSIDVDPQGHVHVTFFGTKDGSHFAVWHSVSTNGAESFGEATKIADVHFPRFSPDARNDTITGIMASRLYPCPQFCIDNSNSASRGNLYMTWTADGATSRLASGLDIYFSRSTDGGATWSRPIVVNDDPRDIKRHQYYSSVTVNNGGVVTVTWYDRRDDPDNAITNYYMAHSFDGGQSFAKNFPVSTRPTDFSSVGDQNGGFGIGEYTQVLSTPGHAIPVWTDGRDGDGDLNIYAAFVPLDKTSLGVERITSVTGKFELGNVTIEDNRARIAYRLGAASHLKLTVSDAAGRVVATPADARYEAGSGEVAVDIAALASGSYFCRLETDFGAATRALNIVR